ncbi:MAG: hypothetical protein MJY84_08775 [Bacteroidales bacterium]|nr:hypothetical protein [Bacteroidales bacterium]
MWKKKSGLTAILAIFLAVFSACAEETVMTVSTNEIKIDGNESCTESFSITSNTGWSISASADWVKAKPVSGSGNCQVMLDIETNSETSPRKCILSVKSADMSITESVSVIQAARVPRENPLIDNIVIAHRGACKEFSLPDNSVAGLRKAIELNLYGSECDINITSDGQVVVTHATKWGGKLIKDNTYEELKGLQKLSNGEDLPLFRDYVRAAMEGNGTRIFVDVKSLSDEAGGNETSIKAGIGAAKIVKELHAEDFVCFIIGRHAVYMGVKEEVGNAWPMAYMNQEASFTTFTNMGCRWGNFDISSFGLDSEKLAEWNRAGIELSFYNIDTEEQIAWWLPNKDKVKACTNYPYKLMKRLGLRQ